MVRPSRRSFLITLLSSIAISSAGCGTVMHPERRGQSRGGPIDWEVAAFDALGLVLFFVPGVICFAVDWYNGTLFLPSHSTGAIPSTKGEFVAIQIGRENLTPTGIQTAIQQHRSVNVSLEPGTYETIELDRIEDFDQALAQLTGPTLESGHVIMRCQSPE